LSLQIFRVVDARKAATVGASSLRPVWRSYTRGRPFLVAVALAVLNGAPDSAIAQRSASAIERVKDAVVAVGTYQRMRSPQFNFRGTGFAVGDGTLVATNAHVLPENLAAGADPEILAIALPGWVQYARTVRGSTLVERNKEYVQAARVIGVASSRILGRHVLPNVLGPVLVLATIQVATAILTEATLSFLGVGVPPTQPSLGTLIRIGNDFLFSGEWWITIFPGVMLVMIALSVNLLGDWLRDALNPRLR